MKRKGEGDARWEVTSRRSAGKKLGKYSKKAKQDSLQ